MAPRKSAVQSAESTVEPDPVPPPVIYYDGEPVYIMITRELSMYHLNKFIEAAVLFGFGWRVDGYDAPINDTKYVREVRFTAWRTATGDVSMSPRPEEPK